MTLWSSVWSETEAQRPGGMACGDAGAPRRMLMPALDRVKAWHNWLRDRDLITELLNRELLTMNRYND